MEFGPDCNDPRLVNPNFSDGSIPGGLNSGGNTTGWDGLLGNPIVVDAVQGSPDGWAISLSGNQDFFDVLQSEQAICLQPQEVISLRVAAKPGNERRTCDIMKVELLAGTELKTLATFPLTGLDSSEWWEFKIPFDVSAWIGLDTCNESLASVSAHLRISVSNALRDNQGGPFTLTEILLDNVCIDNLVFTSNVSSTLPIKISPNPNSGEFVIEMSQPANQKTTLQVISMTGELLIEKKAESGTDLQFIDAMHLLPGMYFLQILQGGHVMSVDKFVKM